VERPKITISDSVFLRIVEEYAREAGVRNLEKQLGRIVRKGVVNLVEGENKPIHVEDSQLESYLGIPVFRANTPPPPKE
jgi:ATP-dependent Lon protease